MKRARPASPSPPPAAGAAAAGASGNPDPLLARCRSVHVLKKVERIDEGTFGVVFKARDEETGEEVAVKEVKVLASQAKDGFPITALREVNVLMSLAHPNILRVREMLVGAKRDKVFMAMDLYDCDVRAALAEEPEPLPRAEVARLLRQLVSATAYMHRRWVLHRDLKTSNLLWSRAERRLALADFGLARVYGHPLRPMTVPVVTLWYRAPELLLGATTYGPAVDMWSVGCIFAELLVREPVLRGEGELDQLDKIFRLVGAPTAASWPGYADLPGAQALSWASLSGAGRLREAFGVSSFGAAVEDRTALGATGLDLLRRMLAIDPAQRITAEEALQHEFLR